MSNRVKVLIAANDATLRGQIARSLLYWGYGSVAASNGLEAWKVLQDVDAPRVALLDTDLVGLDTVEVCRRLRELRGRDSFVLVLSWPHAKAEALEAIAAGAYGIVEKPVHLRELGIRLAGRLAAPECGARVPVTARCRREEQGGATGSDTCVHLNSRCARADGHTRSIRPSRSASL